jgi:hypothetical protein
MDTLQWDAKYFSVEPDNNLTMVGGVIPPSLVMDSSSNFRPTFSRVQASSGHQVTRNGLANILASI